VVDLTFDITYLGAVEIVVLANPAQIVGNNAPFCSFQGRESAVSEETIEILSTISSDINCLKSYHHSKK